MPISSSRYLTFILRPRTLPRKGPPSLEILEAGTGHGALTLHLARAVHCANRPKSSTVSKLEQAKDKPSDCKPRGIEDESESESTNLHEHLKDERRAVIHTIDISPKHRKDAEAIIKGFRQGMYLNDIEFHVGDVSEWIDDQTKHRELDREDASFLSHILLDMPNADQHIEKAASALHVNGNLLAFSPSISQIMAIVEIVKRRQLPLQLDRVVELGSNMTGGREWDVRAVKPRVLAKVTNRKGLPEATDGKDRRNMDDNHMEECFTSSTDSRVETQDGKDGGKVERESGWEMVCRPKVGDRIDEVDGVILARKKNARTKVHADALAQAKEYERTMVLRIFKMAVSNAGLEVRSAKDKGGNQGGGGGYGGSGDTGGFGVLGDLVGGGERSTRSGRGLG